MKSIVVAVVAVLGGFLLGWVLGPGKYRYHYTATRDIHLQDSGGNRVAIVPKNSPLLSDQRLGDSVDLGWWGYVPVYFSTMTEARSAGVLPAKEVSSIMEIKLNAVKLPPSQPPKRD